MTDEAPPPRPLYLRPSYLLMLLVGGATGTTGRFWLERELAAPAGTWPWTTFAINVVGSFLLGLLLTTLARAGPDKGWRRRVRVGVGTGMLGGFTTYSTFVVEVDLLLRTGHVATAAAYALVSVTAGIAAALVGVAVARLLVVGDRPRHGGSR